MNDDPTTPAYWTRNWYQPGGGFNVATDQAHSGLRSFKLAATTANRIAWRQSVHLEPRTTYRLSAWVRAQGVKHSIEPNDRGGNIAIHSISPDEFPQSSEPVYDTVGEWRPIFLDYTTKNQKTDAEVLLQLGADQGTTTGTAWLDDVILKKRDCHSGGETHH